MDESDTPCVFCRRPVIQATGVGGTYWIHEYTRKSMCDPNYASPDFIFKDNIRRY